jgi:RsiW-degrading membrane proteinase PrsW (M82 family)
MVIVVECECGRKLRADAKLAGRWVKCPQCSRAVQVPTLDAPPPLPAVPIATFAEPAPSPPSALEDLAMATAPHRGEAAPIPPPRFSKPDMSAYSTPRAVIAPPPGDIEAAEKSWRGYVFWLLLVAMIPLAIQTFAGHEDILERINHTLDQHPEIAEKVHPSEHLTRRDEQRILDMLPEHRLDGALVARDSLIQWPCALAATGLFFSIIVFAIPGFPARPLRLFLSGLFSGTVSVLVLYAIQIIGFLCVCCIGAAYLAAIDPRAPFGPSLLGFFFGVGFFEETVKSLPVLWLLYNRHSVPWREACLVGMAAGAGFGISEGIHYSSGVYNGVVPGSIYLMRFLSCVSFHTCLSAICAIFLQRKQYLLDEGKGLGDWLMTFMAIISPAMLLHGLFDTLEKKDIHFGSLAVAMATFGWLAFLINQSRARELFVAAPVQGKGKFVKTAQGTRYVAD